MYASLFGLLMVLLFTPSLQQHLGLITTEPLEGFVSKTEMPQLNFEDYTSSKYQHQLESYLSENFGFREPVIRLYNQYLWTCYKKTYCHFITPGKDGYLFYTEAVKDYYGIESIELYRTYDRARQWARQNVRMMNKLRYVLHDYGVEFLCFMAPNKTQLYPEYLPYHKTIPPDAINTADYYDSLMTAIGFPHVEMTRWYQQIKDTATFQLIPKHDTHWRYSAAYGYDSLFSYMNSLNNFGIPDIKVHGMKQLDTMYREIDEKALNLIFDIPNDSPKYWPEISVECDSNCRKPRVLFVGDSFINDFGTYLPWEEVLDNVEIWFYNETVIKNYKEKYPITHINRLRSLLNADYVVWYSTGSQWPRCSYDFVENALLQLCVTDSLFDAQIPWVMDSLSNDSAFKVRHCTAMPTEHYADTLRKYAIMALKDNPELIPGLSGEAMPTIRNTKAIAAAQHANAIANDKLWLKALEMKAYKTGQSLDQLIDLEANNLILGLPLMKQEIQIDTASIVQFEIEKLIDNWLDHPDVVKYLENKAKEKDRTFEQVLQEDATWVINQQLNNGELY